MKTFPLHRLLVVFLILNLWMNVAAFGAEKIRVTTWNLEWFPNGSAKELPEEKQQERIEAVAKVLRDINPDVLLVQEVKDWPTCEKLAQSIAPNTYQVLVCSAFREDRPGSTGAVGKQQVAILSKKPAHAAWSEPWKSGGAADPPRGFVFATIPIGEKLLAFYSLHLKSNVVSRNKEKEEEDIKLNRLKREVSAEQLITHMKDIQEHILPGVKLFVVGGDMNTNVDDPLFKEEKTLKTFTDAGLSTSFEGMESKDRITHPAEGQYPAVTFDHMFFQGIKLLGKPKIVETKASDHLPVTCEFEIP